MRQNCHLVVSFVNANDLPKHLQSMVFYHHMFASCLWTTWKAPNVHDTKATWISRAPTLMDMRDDVYSYILKVYLRTRCTILSLQSTMQQLNSLSTMWSTPKLVKRCRLCSAPLGDGSLIACIIGVASKHIPFMPPGWNMEWVYCFWALFVSGHKSVSSRGCCVSTTQWFGL